jgi:hypothetical protein
MAKTGLSNSLIGKFIVPKPEYGDPQKKDEGPNYNIWANMKPHKQGGYIAEIGAAYTEDGVVKVMATDPWGNNSIFFINNVNLKVD